MSELKKMLLILNPCSGMKQGTRRLSELVSVFQSGGYLCTTMITDRRFAAAEYAAQYGRDMDMIVCVGGDGTYNEVMNGVIDSGIDVPLGYIPAGSTNDFAKSMHLSSDVITAAEDILNGEVCSYDAGSFGGRKFSYVASFGAFTRTSYSTPQNFKNTFGHLAYIMSGAVDLLQLHPEHVRLETDSGDFEGDYIFGAICNSTSLGGVLTVSEDMVDMTDGRFELLLIHHPANVGELLQITNALTKKQYDCGMIDFVSIKHADIITEYQMDWSLDGECFSAGLRTEMETLHGAVKLCVPKQVIV